jgi:radical SAM protein with 4Fe4S-binding SPASM domain
MQDLFKAFDRTRDLKDKPFKSLCYAPDLQLTFSPNGDATACCISRSHVLGNLRTERLDDIWHGERVRQFRAMLHEYVFAPGCERCQWSLEGGNFLDHPIRQYDEIGQFRRAGIAVDERARWPAKLEFALSNTCNLACVMCSGEYSSVLRAREGLAPLAPAYGDEFFEDLRRYLPHVRTLAFLGGEPFLQKECHRIWDMLIDMDLAIPCHVTTNGTVYNDRVEKLLAALPFNLSISIDGVTKETVESIRVNVKYETLMQNVRKFDAYVRGKSDRHRKKRLPFLELNFCVMRSNWHELAEFFSFAEDLGARVWTILVTYPRECSLFSLPKDELRQVVAHLERQTGTLVRRLKKNRRAWQALVTELDQHLAEQSSAVDEMVQAAPRNRAAAPDRLASAMEQAWRHMSEGNVEDALRAALRTPPTDPLYMKALTLVGEIRTNEGDFEGAENALAEAIRVAPGHPEAYLRRAWLRYHQGRFADGLAELEVAGRCASKLARVEEFIETELLRARATLLYHLGDTERAVESLNRFLAVSPDDDHAKRMRDEVNTRLRR